MPATMPVRVTLLDTWDELTLDVAPSTSITEVKRRALAHAHIRRPDAEYVVKYLGAELYESGQTLSDAGVVPNGALIVLLRRRIPAK